MNSSDLTSLIWLQQDDILKHINTTSATVATSSGLGPKHFINVITSAGGMAKPSILMFKPSSSVHHQLATAVTQAELTQLVASPGPAPYVSTLSGGSHPPLEEIKYIEMKADYNEDSFQSSSTGSSTLHSINTQVSPHHHSSSLSSGGAPYSPPTPSKLSPPPSLSSSSSSSSPTGSTISSLGGTVAHAHGEYKKPPFSYSQLVFMSIENSSEKALPLREIYSWIEKFFPYYKNAPTGWKNSIRHELSYKNYFKKVTTTAKFIKGAWSVDKVYRPKLYTKLKSFLNHDDKLSHNLSRCLCEAVSKADLFSFINNNNDDEISAASIIMELRGQQSPGPCGPAPGPTKPDQCRAERDGGSGNALRAAKVTKRKHVTSEKQPQYSKNNNSLLVSNLNTPVTVVAADYEPGASSGAAVVYEFSPNKRIKVEPAGELEGEEPVVNIKIEDASSPEMYESDPLEMGGAFDDGKVKMEVVVKEEEDACVAYDGTVVASEVVYQEDVSDVDERVRRHLSSRSETQAGRREDPCGGDIIRDPFSEIRDSYVEEMEEEEEEKRKRDGAACALLHLAGFSAALDSPAAKLNAVAKSRNAAKPSATGPGRRKVKVLKVAGSGSSFGGHQAVSSSSSGKKNNSWTLLTYPELFACQSSGTVTTGGIER